MHILKKLRFLVILVLLLGLIPTSVYADEVGQLQLSANKDTLQINQETTVNIQVKDAPSIYGADVRLSFDPDILEVVDADKDTPGVQVQPGKFIDPEKAFVLQHTVDNETGTIDYALALLNPAPAVQGNGSLAKITFRAKQAGTASITLEEGQFGTQTGETLNPTLSSIDIEVRDKNGTNTTNNALSSEENLPENGLERGESPRLLILIVGLFIGLAIVGLLGKRFLQKRN